MLHPPIRHASIDAATRAARGLPEDLIRLCVGIEDSNDLLDDLDHALLEAGAIELNAAQNKFVRAPNPDSLSQAVQDLNLDQDKNQMEWFVSSPGKVILFGEHAVVHGVVSLFVLDPLFACPACSFREERTVYPLAPRRLLLPVLSKYFLLPFLF